MTEIKYEITMYQLLIIFVASVFIAIIFGSWMGGSAGYAKGANEVTVTTPNYCHVDRHGGEITVECTELKDVSAEEFCNVLSPTLGKKIKILVAG